MSIPRTNDEKKINPLFVFLGLFSLTNCSKTINCNEINQDVIKYEKYY